MYWKIVIAVAQLLTETIVLNVDRKNSKELTILMSLMKLKVSHSILKKDFSILLKISY